MTATPDNQMNPSHAHPLPQLQATLDAIMDGIAVVGLDGRIKAFGKRFQEILGMPDKEIARDGTRRYVNVNYDPHVDGGEVKGVFASILDVTERKEVEKALEKSEQKLKFILKKLPVLMWQKDRNGTYLQVNKAFFDIYGLPAKCPSSRICPPGFARDDVLFYRIRGPAVMIIAGSSICPDGRFTSRWGLRA